MTTDPRESLDHFGQFLAENLRDNVMNHFDLMAQGHWKSPALQELQSRIVNMTDDDKSVMRRALLASLDSGIHDLLFKLQEQADFENRISIKVDGNDIIAESDGLHGEIFSEEGWFAKFSKDGEPPEKH